MRRHRKLTWLAAGAAFFLVLVLGVGLGAAQGPGGFWLFCSGSPLSCDEQAPPTTTETTVSTVTEPGPTTTLPGTTVTVTAPTTTEPPPTTTAPPPTTTTEPDPDPPDGTVISLVNAPFICTGPLEQLGELPIIVEQHLTNDHPNARRARGAIDIEAGCRGDGNPATDDLVIRQYGNGTNLGAARDPIVIFPGARDLTITGFTDCGYIWPGGPGDGDEAHQDGFDLRGGTDILVHDYEMGDWDAQRATCQGAGGLWYVSAFLNSHSPKDDPNLLQRVVCVRCKFVAGKPYDPEANAGGRAGFIVQSVDSGARDSCFSGFIPFQIRLDAPSPRGAIRPIDERNLKIDRDAGGQPSPGACEA